MIRLIGRHGFDILRINNDYLSKLKEEIINKVFIEDQSNVGIAIEYGLFNHGMLTSWINLYKNNGYGIVEKKRGRSSTMNK